MKLLSVVSIALLSVLVLGSDGDGDGIGVTTDTTAEETETVEETTAPVIIDTGSETIEPGDADVMSHFNIFETGVIEARVEWSSGPSKVDLTLTHDSTVSATQVSVESPAAVLMQATQDLLNNSNGWVLVVNNPSGSEQAIVDYIVRLTPD